MPARTITIEIAHETLHLHALKAIYWPREKMLILCDIHVGKVGHFRKHGISVPQKSSQINYWNLAILIESFRPEKMVVIGDLTHSQANNEWIEWSDFMDQYPALEKWVVVGNHDSPKSEAFQKLGFKMVDSLTIAPFVFVHEPLQINEWSSENYYLSGHIHPGIRLVGKAKSSLIIPCFCFGIQQALLPAFGAFTGYVPIRPNKKDKIFGISENQIIELNP